MELFAIFYCVQQHFPLELKYNKPHHDMFSYWYNGRDEGENWGF